MFEKVQAMIAENSERDRETRGVPVPYSENVLRGKIFCAKCGNPLHRQRKNKDGTYWFRCESQWRCKKDAYVVVSVKESALKSEVLALLHKYSETILGRFITIEREKPGAACDAELGINARIDKSGRMLKSLYESMVNALITADEFVRMKTGYEAEISTLSERADELRELRCEAAAAAEKYRDIAGAVSAALADNRLTTEIIERLVDKIFVKPDKSFEIRFTFSDEFADAADGSGEAMGREGRRTA
jgi:hypothetical protein